MFSLGAIEIGIVLVLSTIGTALLFRSRRAGGFLLIAALSWAVAGLLTPADLLSSTLLAIALLAFFVSGKLVGARAGVVSHAA